MIVNIVLSLAVDIVYFLDCSDRFDSSYVHIFKSCFLYFVSFTYAVNLNKKCMLHNLHSIYIANIYVTHFLM